MNNLIHFRFGDEGFGLINDVKKVPQRCPVLEHAVYLCKNCCRSSGWLGVSGVLLCVLISWHYQVYFNFFILLVNMIRLFVVVKMIPIYTCISFTSQVTNFSFVLAKAIYVSKGLPYKCDNQLFVFILQPS